MRDLNSPLAVFVFSYNRGPFLQKALESVRSNLPDIPLVIFDDGSQDAETRVVLQRWEETAHVFSHENSPSEGRVGGLHLNMDRAFRYASANGIKYFLMLADDMQVVRPLTDRDYALIDEYFASNEECCQLLVHFRTRERDEPEGEWTFDNSRTASFSTVGELSGYYAAGLFSVARVMDRLIPLAPTERENGARAEQQGITTGFYRFPFVMFMPFPKTFRRGRRNMFLLVTETLAGCGVHPFDYMEADSVARLFSRDKTSPPVAREWLVCPSVANLRRWSYYGGARDLRARDGWRGWIGRVAGGMAPKG